MSDTEVIDIMICHECGWAGDAGELVGGCCPDCDNADVEEDTEEIPA